MSLRLSRPQSLTKARQGLGESQPKGARVLAPRLNPPHAQKTLQSGLKSPDGLLEIAIHGPNPVHHAGANNERPLEPKTIHSPDGDGSFAHAHRYRRSVHGIALLQSLVRRGLIRLGSRIVSGCRPGLRDLTHSRGRRRALSS